MPITTQPHSISDIYASFDAATYQIFRAAMVRETSTFTLDLARVEKAAFQGNGPAYKLMEAMVSVVQHEDLDGCRGAPRLLLAVLVHLANISNSNASD